VTVCARCRKGWQEGGALHSEDVPLVDDEMINEVIFDTEGDRSLEELTQIRELLVELRPDARAG
jgi:hypothetical protein